MKNLYIVLITAFLIASCAQDDNTAAKKTGENENPSTEPGAGEAASQEGNNSESDPTEGNEGFDPEDIQGNKFPKDASMNDFHVVNDWSFWRWDPLVLGAEKAIEESIQACLTEISNKWMDEYKAGRAACIIKEYTWGDPLSFFVKRSVFNINIIDRGPGIGEAIVRIYWYHDANTLTFRYFRTLERQR